MGCDDCVGIYFHSALAHGDRRFLRVGAGKFVLFMNGTRKILQDHLLSGRLVPGEEIGLRIDQTLTQDATGTLVMMELEAMHLDRVKTEISAQYVDHNLLQVDYRNPDDHLFLESACNRFGIWYSKAGNGISHVVHQERFGKPGKTLLGSDSHTPAQGALGMLAFGAGGLEVAMAMAGEPFYIPMPRIWGVRLVGELPPWVSAKDIILEMLRRHGVREAKQWILEYFGPGLEHLSVMDRHVIANMGTETGALTTVFPSDETVRTFLASQGRAADWIPLYADKDAAYDRVEEIDLSKLEPLVALPSSPGNVKPVSEVAGAPIYQAYVGSSANPGYRDYAVVAEVFRGRHAADNVSLDINPSSNQTLLNLVRDGHIGTLLKAGARLHQAGCGGCIGMGQAPATGKISLRTVPRNFPGRSGTEDDLVYLVSPETAAASALTGVITDPRTLEMNYPHVVEPVYSEISESLLIPPLPPAEARSVVLQRGPNIDKIPYLDAIHNDMDLPVLLKVGDDISTDEILPAGAKVLPFRSNIRKLSEFVFASVDPGYVERARKDHHHLHAIVAGYNYGQGSSREHAALAPRYLGLRAVIAKTFARIHKENLVNFGVLPLQFQQETDYDRIDLGDILKLTGIDAALRLHKPITVYNATKKESYPTTYELTPRERKVILAGGMLNLALSHAA